MNLKWIVVLAAVATLGSPSRVKAQAPPTAKCEIVEFLAENTDKASVDARLGKWRTALTKPPFTAYNTFTVLDLKTASTTKGRAQTVKMTSTLTLLLKNISTGSGQKSRLSYRIDIDDAAGNRWYGADVDVDAGHADFYTAGDHKSGKLFLALSCTL